MNNALFTMQYICRFSIFRGGFFIDLAAVLVTSAEESVRIRKGDRV